MQKLVLFNTAVEYRSLKSGSIKARMFINAHRAFSGRDDVSNDK